MDTRTEADFHIAANGRYVPAILRLLRHKGGQYAPDQQPALINFYEGSELAKDSPAHYLMVLATKQWQTVCNWSHDGSIVAARKREIAQRIMDVIIYLFLLLFMIEDQGQLDLGGDK